jgi:hypothetical protein
MHIDGSCFYACHVETGCVPPNILVDCESSS